MKIDAYLRVRNVKTKLIWRVTAIESFKNAVTGEWQSEVLLTTPTSISSSRDARLPLEKFQTLIDSGDVQAIDDDGNVKTQ